MATLPLDACPYLRPFPNDFAECAAQEEIRLRPQVLSSGLSRSVVSCRHLTVGRVSDGPMNHHYGRCQLGGVATRPALLRTKIVHSDTYINTHADPDEFDLRPPPAIPPQ